MPTIELTDEQLTFIHSVLGQLSVQASSGPQSMRLIADVLEAFGVTGTEALAPNGKVKTAR